MSHPAAAAAAAAAAATSRLPPALQVFPTLANFPALHPRRLYRIPIGCRHSEVVSLFDLRRSVLHLYHDLGVLVFAGCSAAQIREIGDVLRQVVTWGGPGGMYSMLHNRTVKFRREREAADAFGKEDIQEVMDRRGGIIKLESIIRLAKARLKKQLDERVQGMRPTVKGIVTRNLGIMVPWGPPPSSMIHRTVSGPRCLPIESWASLTVEKSSGHLLGEISFFTAGTGEYLGAAHVKYLMYQRKADTGDLTPFWAHGRIPERMSREPQLVRERMDKVVDRVMRPLWTMEGDIWAKKAQALALARANQREQAEWERMRLGSFRSASGR